MLLDDEKIRYMQFEEGLPFLTDIPDKLLDELKGAISTDCIAPDATEKISEYISNRGFSVIWGIRLDELFPDNTFEDYLEII